MKIETVAKNVKLASIKFRSSNARDRNKALEAIAKTLKANTSNILIANKKDLKNAKTMGLNSAMTDRLRLSKESIKDIIQSVRAIKNQNEVVGIIDEKYKRPNGLIVQKQRIPLGTVAMIFESRPNVVVDGAALAIKSGNCILLKGGKEAYHSNKILGQLIRRAIKNFIPENVVVVLDSKKREHIDTILKLHQYIDLVVPRGGENLIKYVQANATMPVIAHFKGLCHTYIHEDANISKAISIAFNAKAHRTGVCNAMETLLINEKIAKTILVKLIPYYKSAGIEIRGCLKTCRFVKGIKKATKKDWSTEYLDKIISIRIVTSMDEAIKHINSYGTFHTECIVAKNKKAIEKFSQLVDASCIMINASTRFNDGGELGLGAELGISTSKFHAYGPMGAKEMTATRFLVQGSGQIRS